MAFEIINLLTYLLTYLPVSLCLERHVQR